MHPYIWLLIAIIIIIIFIRGTSIKEGARGRNKGKDKKSSEANTPSQTNATSETNSTPQNNATPQKKHKKRQNKKKPFNLVKTAQNALLKPKLKSIEHSQKFIKQKEKEIANAQKSLDAKIYDLSLNITQQKDEMNKYTSDLSLNMYNQFTLYKTSITNAANLGISDISGSVVAAQRFAASAASAANDASKYSNNASASANRAEQVYKDVFGKSSASIIQNNISDLSGNNTTDLSGKTEAFTTFKEGLNSIYTTTVSTNKYIYDLETDVVSKLNDFNTTYYAYMKCKSGTNTCSYTDVQSKATQLNAAIAALKSAYQRDSDDISGTAFETKHTNTLQLSDRVASMRADLDAKMANIMTPMHEITRDYDASVYTGITLSILAASLAYYLVTP